MRILGLTSKNSGCGYHRVMVPVSLMPKEKGRITDVCNDEVLSLGWDVVLVNRMWHDNLLEQRDKYGFKLVVRFSDHDAMTGRSECADLQYVTTEMFKGVWQGRYESMFGFDGDDFDTSGDFDYETEAERNETVFNVIIAEINSKLDF